MFNKSKIISVFLAALFLFSGCGKTETNPPVETNPPTNTEAAASEQTETAASVEAQRVTVYITETGEKYHRDGCQYLYNSKIETYLDELNEKKFTPCSVCNPPTH